MLWRFKFWICPLKSKLKGLSWNPEKYSDIKRSHLNLISQLMPCFSNIPQQKERPQNGIENKNIVVTLLWIINLWTCFKYFDHLIQKINLVHTEMSTDIDRDYSPSMWTKRFNSSEETLSHFQRLGSESKFSTKKINLNFHSKFIFSLSRMLWEIPMWAKHFLWRVWTGKIGHFWNRPTKRVPSIRFCSRRILAALRKRSFWISNQTISWKWS